MLENLISAFENRTPVLIRRPLEGNLNCNRILAIIPDFDKKGNPDYLAIVEMNNGCPAYCRATDLEVVTC